MGKVNNISVTTPTRASMLQNRKVFKLSVQVPLVLVCFIFVSTCEGYYVGPEVGKAPGETQVLVTRGAIRNATSLAEAAYVPQVYAIGNNVIAFLKSIIPALQPKVDFFAEQIQDSIDTANTKLMQNLENSNNAIIATENFFTGLFKAVVLGKGPEEEARRRRLAVALIKSGMLENITGILTSDSPEATSTTSRPPEANSLSSMATTTGKPETRVMTSALPEVGGNFGEEGRDGNAIRKVRDNNFNKMKVIKIVNNLL